MKKITTTSLDLLQTLRIVEKTCKITNYNSHYFNALQKQKRIYVHNVYVCILHNDITKQNRKNTLMIFGEQVLASIPIYFHQYIIYNHMIIKNTQILKLTHEHTQQSIIKTHVAIHNINRIQKSIKIQKKNQANNCLIQIYIWPTFQRETSYMELHSAPL